MEKEIIVLFETAKLAKEVDFDIMVNHYFANNGREEHFQSKYKANYNSNVSVGLTISRPTQTLVQKWLREIHNIDVIAYPSFMGKKSNYYYLIIINRDFDNIIQGITNNYSFEDALEIGLQEGLKLIKNG